MKTLLVQDYLRFGKTLKDLEVEHGVFSHVQNGVCGFNYGMIEAKESDPLASQCRGLILDQNTFEVVACPMFRFFNHGQGSVPEDFNWNDCVAEEKKDGSCIICYFYNNSWYCGTRGRPLADGQIDGGQLTFAMLVDSVIQKQFNLPTLNDFMNNYFPENAREHTFVFELTSPVNRIVCKYNDFKLTLLAVRNIKTLQEDEPKNWINEGQDLKEVPTPEIYNFNNINHLLEIVNDWSPEEMEGVVLKDKNFNRIKIKNVQYTIYNRMRDSLSTSRRACLEIVLLEKEDDIIPMVSEMIVERITEIKTAFLNLLKETNADYESIKHISNMKDFALLAQTKRWPAVLFALKRNKISIIKDFYYKNGEICGSTLNSILDICNIK